MKSKGKFLLFDSKIEFREWLFEQNVSRKILLIQNHHTASPSYAHFNGSNHFEKLEGMRNFHINDRKFSATAQQFTTFPDGSIGVSLDRTLNIAPAGITGANSNGICIEHLGNFDIGGDKMTEAQKDIIFFLNAILCERFKLPIDTEHVVYHHWWSASGSKVYDLKTGERLQGSAAKTCPGTAFFGGNTVLSAQKYFVPEIIKYNGKILEREDSTMNYDYNKIYKERIFASNGKLIRCDGDYKTKATDVRIIKFQTGKVEYRFVHEKGKKVSELVKKHGADYGFNAPYFYNNLPLGDSKDHDKAISIATGKTLKWHEFDVVNGKPAIGQLNKNDKQDLLVQGAPLLVQNGALVYEKYRVEQEVQDDIGKSRCQRTFIGIDAKGDLWLFIGDGRTTSDQGLTLEEMALFAQSKGCKNALNFDGGGSTILVDQTGGLNQKLNTGANERVVHHALLVYLNKKSEEPKKEDGVKMESGYSPIEIDLIDTKTNTSETVQGFVKDGKSFVEVRKAGEFFGAKVGYSATTKKASLSK